MSKKVDKKILEIIKKAKEEESKLFADFFYTIKNTKEDF